MAKAPIARQPSQVDLAGLAAAHAAARLHGTLDEAMRSPLLARCLAVTAEALAGRPRHPNDYRPPAVAPPHAAIADRPTPTHTHMPARDVKRRSAGDTDD